MAPGRYPNSPECLQATTRGGGPTSSNLAKPQSHGYTNPGGWSRRPWPWEGWQVFHRSSPTVFRGRALQTARPWTSPSRGGLLRLADGQGGSLYTRRAHFQQNAQGPWWGLSAGRSTGPRSAPRDLRPRPARSRSRRRPSAVPILQGEGCWRIQLETAISAIRPVCPAVGGNAYQPPSLGTTRAGAPGEAGHGEIEWPAPANLVLPNLLAEWCNLEVEAARLRSNLRPSHSGPDGARCLDHQGLTPARPPLIPIYRPDCAPPCHGLRLRTTLQTVPPPGKETIPCPTRRSTSWSGIEPNGQDEESLGQGIFPALSRP